MYITIDYIRLNIIDSTLEKLLYCCNKPMEKKKTVQTKQVQSGNTHGLSNFAGK